MFTESLLGEVCVCVVSNDTHMLQNTLKKLGVNTIQGIEEVNMIKDDGHVLHFTNPKGNLIKTITCARIQLQFTYM